MSATSLVRAVVSVADLGRALPFYRDVLGLPVQPRGPGVVGLALACGSEVLLHERPTTPSPAAVVLSFGVADVDAATDAARAAGCAVLDEPTDQPWGERQSVLADADGHVVCLVGTG